MICIITINTVFLQILNAFRTPDDMPMKDLQLKEYNTGEFLGMHVALGEGRVFVGSLHCVLVKIFLRNHS